MTCHQIRPPATASAAIQLPINGEAVASKGLHAAAPRRVGAERVFGPPPDLYLHDRQQLCIDHHSNA